jgi:hypothetical protein
MPLCRLLQLLDALVKGISHPGICEAARLSILGAVD